QGLVEKIGSHDGIVTHETGGVERVYERAIPDYHEGFTLMISAFAEYGPSLDASALDAIGHRVVQGGERYPGPVVIDDQVLRDIDHFSALAPLHNPPALVCIREALAAFPNLPHIAVFDTAFHQTMLPEHYHYAINPELAAK